MAKQDSRRKIENGLKIASLKPPTKNSVKNPSIIASPRTMKGSLGNQT
jgi:hypothetical protein